MSNNEIETGEVISLADIIAKNLDMDQQESYPEIGDDLDVVFIGGDRSTWLKEERVTVIELRQIVDTDLLDGMIHEFSDDRGIVVQFENGEGALFYLSTGTEVAPARDAGVYRVIEYK